MKAVIIAAGQGTRLRNMSPSKPLVSLLGKPLIQHVMERSAAGGVSEFIIVTGYNAPLLEETLTKIRKITGLKIHTIHNPKWEKANGISVLTASKLIDNERFLLMMSDHLFEPGLITAMINCNPQEKELILGIDRHITNNPFVDLEDVTRVRTKGNQILEIGKLLTKYDCFDTGVFNVDHHIFAALTKSIDNGEDSLSSGVSQLRSMGLARVHDVTGHIWIDVDDDKMFSLAEKWLKSG
jgi:choline kinase